MNRMVDVTVTSNIETITSDQLVYVHDGLSSTYLTASVPSTQSLILTFTPALMISHESQLLRRKIETIHFNSIDIQNKTLMCVNIHLKNWLRLEGS